MLDRKSLSAKIYTGNIDSHYGTDYTPPYVTDPKDGGSYSVVVDNIPYGSPIFVSDLEKSLYVYLKGNYRFTQPFNPRVPDFNSQLTWEPADIDHTIIRDEKIYYKPDNQSVNPPLEYFITSDSMAIALYRAYIEVWTRNQQTFERFLSILPPDPPPFKIPFSTQ